jgi:adenylate cyclase
VAGAATASALVALVAGLWLNGQQAGLGPKAAPPLSIVVLPFANLSDDPSHEYLSAGITTDLTADLSRIPGLLVIGQATSQTFKGRTLDARAISQELNVRYLLDGSVRQKGDEIRFAVQLIDGETGMTRWAERFDRTRAQLLEWQDEIVGRIAIALDYRLTILESERVLRERPNSPEAFDLTARGWALVYAAKSPENYEAARALFVKAIERDPRAINARAGIAWSLGILVLNGWSKSVDQDTEMARVAVAELLALDPNHVIAHHVRGFLLRVQRRTETAVDAFAAATAINPNFAPSHAQLGVSYLELGRPEDAIRSAERAIRLSPRDPNARSWFAFVGMANLHLGRDLEAIPWLARAIDTDSPVALHQVYYMSALALAGRVEEARLALAQFRKERPSMTIGRLQASARSVNPIFAQHRERMYSGLRIAGLPE